MPARTKEARIARTLTVKDLKGAPVKFSLKRDWVSPAAGWRPQARQQVTVVTLGPQEDTRYPVYAAVGWYLWLFQSERARAYVVPTPPSDPGEEPRVEPRNIQMAIGKVRQDGTIEHPRNWPVTFGPLPLFDDATATRIEEFINNFHLQHISGAVQKERVQQAVSKLGPARELKRIPIWEVNAAFPEPTAVDGGFDTGEAIAIVYDFPQSGRDELHFVWNPTGAPADNGAGRAVVQRSELQPRGRTSRDPGNVLTVWTGDEDGEDMDTTDFLLIKRIPGERVWSEGNNTSVWPGMYVREEDVASLRLATVYQPMGFPMLGEVGLGDNATTEVNEQAIIEYMGKSKDEGAKLRFTVTYNKKQYVFTTTQKHLMTSKGDGVRVTDGTTGWSAVHITVPHSLVAHILVALDKRIEEGLAGVESILQPWRSTVAYPPGSYWDAPDQDHGVELAPVGRIKVSFVKSDGTTGMQWTELSKSRIHELLKGPRVETRVGVAVPTDLHWQSWRRQHPNEVWSPDDNADLFLVSDLERALVAFDRLEEMGTPLDGLGAAGRPNNRVFVTDVNGRKWQAKMTQSQGWGAALVYRPMIGRNYDGGDRTLYTHGTPVRLHPTQLTVPAGGPNITGFVVAPERDHRSLTHEVDIEAIPLLSEAEATRLLAAVTAYFDYFATGQNQLDYRAGKANKLGRAAQVATLKVWRNPVEGGTPFTNDHNGDERLAVYVYPESGTDTVGLETDLTESQKDRVSQISLRPTLFTHASVLGARYAQPSYNTIPERVRGGAGSEDLILVYPFGMETYNAGNHQTKRVGLYARVSDVYNALYAGWREHQKGWGQRDGGLRTMPNFPFEVELLWGQANVPAAGRIEYMGKNKAGIPQFEVTADATRGATSGAWSKRVRGQVVPRTFYTDAKMLQRTPNLYESKDLLKWQHSHNPGGNPALLGPANGTRLSPESHQQVLVALDARYEAGLKGAEWSEEGEERAYGREKHHRLTIPIRNPQIFERDWGQRVLPSGGEYTLVLMRPDKTAWSMARGLLRVSFEQRVDGRLTWASGTWVNSEEDVLNSLRAGRVSLTYNLTRGGLYATADIIDPKDARSTFEVWSDKLKDKGLLGLGDQSQPHLFPLFERDDTGYPSHTSDAFAKVGMGRDGYPYVWVYRVRDYVFDGKRMVPHELPKPVLTITQSIFAFTNSRELYYGFKANRADGDREEVNWHINRPDIDAIRAEVCRKLQSGEVKLDDWTRGHGAWCDPVAKPEGLEGAGTAALVAAASLPGIPGVLLADAATEVVDDGGMCEGE